jgi:hypothetical protein
MHVACLWLMLACGQATDSAPTNSQIVAAVRNLASEKYAERKAASDWLWQQGAVVEDALNEAEDSDDFEVRMRAGEILKFFRLGIYPDTPREVSALLSEYAQATRQRQQAILNDLRRVDEWRSIAHLARWTMSYQERLRFSQLFEDYLPEATQQALQAGNFEQAEVWLLISACNGSAPARRQLALLYWTENRLAEGTRRFEELVQRETLSGQRRGRTPWNGAASARQRDHYENQILITLRRAAGDSAGMQDVVLDQENAALKLALARERRDWQLLADDCGDAFHDQWTPPAQRLGKAAVYYRLAGDDERADKQADSLLAHLKEAPQHAREGGQFLLLAGRVDDTLAIWRTHLPEEAFALFAVRRQHAEARAIAQLAAGKSYDRAWFDRLPAPEARAAVPDRFALACRAARYLHHQGDTTGAQRIASVLDGVARSSLAKPAEAQFARRALLDLWHLEHEIGIADAAVSNAALLAEHYRHLDGLGDLFPQHALAAAMWLRICDDLGIAPTAERRFAIVHGLLTPAADDAFPWDSYAESAAGSVKSLRTRHDQEHRLWLLAETSLVHGDRQYAAELLKIPSDDYGPDHTAWYHGFASFGSKDPRRMRRGDLHFIAGQYKAAAEAFEPVGNSILKPLAYYLRGCALARAGQPAAGKRCRRQALLLADDAEKQRVLFQGLLNRGLFQEARYLREAWVRTWPETVSLLGQEMGNLMVREDPGAAADHWESLVAAMAEGKVTPSGVESYLQLYYALHAARGRQLVKQHQPELAECHWQQCRHVLPGVDASARPAYALPTIVQQKRTANRDELVIEVLLRRP